MDVIRIFLSNFAKESFGRSPEEASKKGLCIICGKKINLEIEFRDKLSLKEYRISGLCQKCQDGVF